MSKIEIKRKLVCPHCFREIEIADVIKALNLGTTALDEIYFSFKKIISDATDQAIPEIIENQEEIILDHLSEKLKKFNSDAETMLNKIADELYKIKYEDKK